MYSAFGRKLFESADSNAASIEIAVLKGKLQSRRPPQDEFSVGFRQIAFTNSNTKQKNLVRYILRKFAEDAGYKYSVDFDDLTIEHLAPQSLIGSGPWTDETVGQLGNLFLLDPKTNGLLANKLFVEKMRLLNEGDLSVPAFIKEKSSWLDDDISSHTEQMAAHAYTSIWAI